MIQSIKENLSEIVATFAIRISIQASDIQKIIHNHNLNPKKDVSFYKGLPLRKI